MYFSNSLRVKNCFRQFSLFNFQGSALSVRKLIKYITNILVCQALFSTFCKFFLLFCFFRSFPEDFYSFPVRGRPSRDSLFIIPASFPFVKPFFKVFCGFLNLFPGHQMLYAWNILDHKYSPTTPAKFPIIIYYLLSIIYYLIYISTTTSAARQTVYRYRPPRLVGSIKKMFCALPCMAA